MSRAPCGALAHPRQVRIVADDGRACCRRCGAAPLDVKPVLVLTGTRWRSRPPSTTRWHRARGCGSLAHSGRRRGQGRHGRGGARQAREPAALDLIATGATNYRRWANFPWAVVESGGQATPASGRPRTHAPRRPRRSRPPAQSLDPLLHAERPPRVGGTGLDRQLQLRQPHGSSGAMARRPGGRRGFHRERPGPKYSPRRCTNPGVAGLAASSASGRAGSRSRRPQRRSRADRRALSNMPPVADVPSVIDSVRLGADVTIPRCRPVREALP